METYQEGEDHWVGNGSHAEGRSTGDEGAPERRGRGADAAADSGPPPVAASLWSGGRMALCFTNDR